MMSRSQDLSAGGHSTNSQAGRDSLQAGRDLVQADGNVYLINGMTYDQVRQIALDVYNSNFLKLAGVAEDVARDRAERITNEFLKTLQARNPASLASVSDPDMLRTLYAAQEGYACSGEEDLEAALIDLLVDRAGQTERDLKTHVLNQAVATLPKLTKQQRATLAIIFFTKNSRYTGPFNLASYYNYVDKFLVPFMNLIPEKSSDLGYMQYTGVGSISLGQITLEMTFYNSAYGFFMNGFTQEGTSPAERLPNPVAEPSWIPFLGDPDVFMPCIRNSEKLQIKARSLSEVQELADAKNIPTLVTHAPTGRMKEPEIKANLITRFPSMEKLVDKWDTLGLSRFELTAVGIAIGHAFQRKVVGHSAPLELFLI